MSILGAIIGDICGSVWEYRGDRPESVELFPAEGRHTDDTILMAAVVDAIMSGSPYAEKLVKWYWRYPCADWGLRFRAWCEAGGKSIGRSCGNGAAVRALPIGWLFRDLKTVLEQAALSAMPSHNHQESIRAAQAVAGSVLMARSGRSMGEIKAWIEGRFGYDLTRQYLPVPINHELRETCLFTVPQALAAFVQTDDFEGAVKRAVLTISDADSGAAITGAVAGAFYGVPPELRRKALGYLNDDLRALLIRFERTVGANSVQSDTRTRILLPSISQ